MENLSNQQTEITRPKREDYNNTKEWFAAISEYNKKQASKINIGKQDSSNPEFCTNQNTMQEKMDDSDKLIKFKKGDAIYCMYVSEFKKYIQNICNFYTQWSCSNDKICNKDGDTSGRGYVPLLQAYDILGILKFTNRCCVINHLYWQVPIFSKGLLSMKTILKIQELVNNSTNDEIEINISVVNKKKDEFRLGNIYGTFGIGQSHAQADPTIFYVLESESEIESAYLDDCIIKPDNDFFAFDEMVDKLSLQLEIKDLINNLYNRPLDLYSNESLKKFFLSDDEKEGFQEPDLCPDTETVVQIFFVYYNNEILVHSYEKDQDTPMEKITEQMTLKEMRRIINKNQEIIQKHEEEHDNNMNNSFSEGDSINNDNIRDLMTEWSSEQYDNNTYTPIPSSPGARELFNSPPVSPITGNLLDESIRDDYNSILGHESLDISRDPIMDSLHLSDLQDNNDSQSERLRRQRSPSFEEESGINLFGDDDDDDSRNESTQLPQQQSVSVGGKKTFNRKKKPKKNKTKKKKNTRKKVKKQYAKNK